MQPRHLTHQLLRPAAALASAVALLGLAVEPAASSAFAGEASVTEYQEKAVFLLNFTKYVDWPANTFATTNSPIVIGMYGENQIGEDLQKIVVGKIIGGHSIVVRSIDDPEAAGACQILFIAGADRKRAGEILEHVKQHPVLTVGEADTFLDQGGMINLAKRENRIRLEINLPATQQGRLQLSSKLLGVADVVKGRSS